MTDGKPQPHPPGRHTMRSGENRIYQHLGVRDLREIIDRKRIERSYNKADTAPPDPPYNNLKDPLRESTEQNDQEFQQVNSQNSKNKPNSSKRDKAQFRRHKSNRSLLKDIQSPMNIKVEFSTSTGEHIYKLDKSTVLPTIKHVPDHSPPYNRSFKEQNSGYGQSSRNYNTRTIKNNKMLSDHIAESGQPNVRRIKQISVTGEENWGDAQSEPQEVSEQATCYNQDRQEGEEYDDEYDENDNENYIKKELEKHIENLKLDEGGSLKSQSDKNKKENV